MQNHDEKECNNKNAEEHMMKSFEDLEVNAMSVLKSKVDIMQNLTLKEVRYQLLNSY